ncbi:hypothetical protein OBBRIDRAFT_119964 [Obba rivulosa]|uniref:Uncharacterized protein n=1 Tax=Obba rivulosa TaxID=1052685 RepID=A0A8E2DIE7_9APHY|nr:hypothetical protein OBBRIDRAFT_119964 [Obba rivulosa]
MQVTILRTAPKRSALCLGVAALPRAAHRLSDTSTSLDEHAGVIWHLQTCSSFLRPPTSRLVRMARSGCPAMIIHSLACSTGAILDIIRHPLSSRSMRDCIRLIIVLHMSLPTRIRRGEYVREDSG